MHKFLTVSIAILVVSIVGIAGYLTLRSNTVSTGQIADQAPFDARNSSFKIEGTHVTLVNGIAEVEIASIPGAKSTTRYFGNELKHDLDNDGRDDVIFLVTQERGGGGTFFYVVAVLNTGRVYVGSDSYLLGDRIAPQSINVDEGATTRGTLRDNVIVINFAVRKPKEPMTTPPSIGESVWLKLDPATLQFAEVEQNFEG
jgi:hypothetical protein